MKKAVSLLLSIIIVFSAVCYSVNASENSCEYVDYPCYKYFRMFAFDKDDYIEELSENVGSIDVSEYYVSVTPEKVSEQVKVFLSIDGDNYVKLLKAVVALKEKATTFDFEGYAGCSLDSTATVKFSLLDENFEAKESKTEKFPSDSNFSSKVSLTPVISKYLCVTIKFGADSGADAEVYFGAFVFAWSGEHQMVTIEKETDGHISYVNDCTVCNCMFGGYFDLTMPPLHERVEVPEVPASCSQTGLSGGWKCKNCNEIVEPQIEIPKLSHNETVINSIKETYFTRGYTGDTVCADCGEVINKGKIIAKLTLKTPKFKLVKGKGKFKVKYTKVKDATGFQVRYKTKSKWRKVNFDTKKSASKIVKNLKKGKYQVQIRAFVKQGKQKAYSAWSKAKKVKVF